MHTTSSVIARLGQGVSQACTRLHEAGTQFAASAAGQVERALACCRRTAWPQPPAGPAAHEVAPPLRQRQVGVLQLPAGVDTHDFQRVQRLQRTLAETEIAVANDPYQATRQVLAAFRGSLADLDIPVVEAAGDPGIPIPGQLDDAPAANDHGHPGDFERF